MKSRDQLLVEFCKTADLDGMTKLMAGALDTLQYLESSNGFKAAQIIQLNAQIARQSQMITDLNNALKR